MQKFIVQVEVEADDMRSAVHEVEHAFKYVETSAKVLWPETKNKRVIY